MTELDETLGLCWGKAAPDVPGGWHPVLLHMLDVAAAAHVYLEAVAGPRQRDLLGVEEAKRRQSVYFIACHDLGKISPGFQAKVPSLAAPLGEHGLPFSPSDATDHAALTQATLADLLEDCGFDEDLADAATAAVAAHHGAFHFNSLKGTGGEPWGDLRAAAVGALAEAIDCGEPLEMEVTDGWTAALAGLTTLADWIGSNTEWFPYEPRSAADSNYFHRACGKARQAFRALRWFAFPADETWDFQRLFPGFSEPNSVQALARDTAAQLNGPGLLIVEAQTGIGKTEAALLAAEQWLTQHGATGLYFAHPTQATSNQMFGRLEAFLTNRIPDGTNLHLLHSNRIDNADYGRLRHRAVFDNHGGTVVADEWFMGRKRGLLSPFSVGTVDQAMLSALRGQHFFLRMFGLAGSVVVIDEVHAYDAYMSRILDRLLEWLAEMQTAVVLLSATLPEHRRQELLSAYSGESQERKLAAFPRVAATRRGHRATVQSLPPPRSRTVHLRAVTEDASVVAIELRSLSESGGCIAWVCNTVNAVQARYEAALAAGWAPDEVIVFHARFPQQWKTQIEERLLARFSKNGDRPERFLVLATQVIEQSLDVDFDLMVTELAPVDLMLQRAGRVHRHVRRRPAGLTTPALWWHQPLESADAVDFGASQYVYHSHILLRTWLAIRRRTDLRVPEDIDPLMGLVYGEGAQPAAPDTEWATMWNDTASDLEKTLQEHQRLATEQLVPKPGHDDTFYQRLGEHSLDDDEASTKHPSLRARTRLMDDGVDAVCLRRTVDGALTTMDGVAVDVVSPHALRRWSVGIRQRRWVTRLRAEEQPPGWATTAFLRNARPLVFNDEGLATLGELHAHLDPTTGLHLMNDTKPTP